MVRLLGQPMPYGVDYITPSLAKKPTTPSVAEYRRPSWFSFAGQSKAEYRVLPADWASTNSPSDTNNFPEAESSVLESASGTFRVRGDGSGHWGPLTMGRNGIMSGLIVSGEQVLRPDANTVSSVEVTFPPGRFTTTPRVALTQYSSVPQNFSAGAWPVNQDSFVLNIFSVTASARRVAWFAMDGGS